MPAGHTERATVNERRPLTKDMIAILRVLEVRKVHWAELSTGEKNSIRALFDRGLVNGSASPALTDAGRAALKAALPKPSKIQITLDIELDRPLRNAEDGRYLCASLEEGISNGWYDFLMSEESMPAQLKRIVARGLKITQ